MSYIFEKTRGEQDLTKCLTKGKKDIQCGGMKQVRPPIFFSPHYKNLICLTAFSNDFYDISVVAT